MAALPVDPGYGIYNLSAGLVTTPHTAIGGLMTVGAAGTGTFNQSGGTAIFPTTITLGGQASYRKSVPDGYTSNGTRYTTGTYNLSGGLLQTGGFGLGVFGRSDLAVFNFTGGTLQASPDVGGLSVSVPVDLTAATSMCRIDMNGQAVSLQQLTTSSLTDLHFATPGAGGELLTIGSGGIVVNPGTEISLGSIPTGTGYSDLIAGDANAASDLANFTLVGGSGFTLGVDPANGDIALAPVPEPGTLALLGAGLMSLLGYAWRRRKAG